MLSAKKANIKLTQSFLNLQYISQLLLYNHDQFQLVSDRVYISYASNLRHYFRISVPIIISNDKSNEQRQ